MHFTRLAQSILLGLSMLLIAANPAPAADAVANDDFDLFVTDANGNGVAAAQITVSSDGQNNIKLATGTNGHVHIPMPKQPASMFSARATANGFVDKLDEWRNRRTDPVPGTYTWKLEPGMRIGGHVVDGAGQQVAGAHVELWISKRFD